MRGAFDRSGIAAAFSLALCASAPGIGEDAAGKGVAAELMRQGEELYFVNCRQCHGSGGTDGRPLANNRHLEDAALTAKAIVRGRGYMAPFGKRLDDEQIAAIATFIRNAWGNGYGPVAADEVAAVR